MNLKLISFLRSRLRKPRQKAKIQCSPYCVHRRAPSKVRGTSKSDSRESDGARGGRGSLSAIVDYENPGPPLIRLYPLNYSCMLRKRFREVLVAALVVALVCAFVPAAGNAYSVLSHEAIIDVVWRTNIVPLLRQRFPGITPDQLREAHAYAYGGAIIQDMGYYPYGSHFFSDLTHYVRSGDFVENLLRDAQDIDEYAFALGSLSHYIADIDGHNIAVNRVVPLLYPKLEKKYGPYITYEDNPVAHVKSEFGFDVLEVAKERYAPDAYRDFIGFEVAQPLLERAFKETYGLEFNAVIDHESKAIGSYRHAVSKLIPKATRIAWQVKKKDIQQDLPGVTRKKFLYNLSRASYEKNWGRDYHKPDFEERFLAFLFRLIPKIGPLKILTFRTPTPEAEKLFEASFNAIVDRYRAQVTSLGNSPLTLSNDNLDVGKDTSPGTYHLADDTYAKLLHQLAEQNFSGMTPDLRADIEQYYSNPAAPNATKRNAKLWSQVQRELAELKSSTPPPQPVGAD